MSDSEEDLETIRARNIAERNAYMKNFLLELSKGTEEINELEQVRLSLVEEKKTPSTKKRRSSSIRSRSPSFRNSVKVEIVKKYNTRGRKRRLDEGLEEEYDEELYSDKDIIVPKNRSNIKVMFPWARPIQRDIDLMREDFGMEEEDEDENSFELEEPKRKRVVRMSKSTYDPENIPSPDEITQRMLDNIAKKSSGKQYDAINGTSCHQCRQKTRDTKTVCRSGECIGVRGQFCGPCLRGRYGESAYEALKDPIWACPPCRGLCNCSICRTRNGQRPTGILAPIAKEEGYESVKDYLQANDYED